MNAFDERNRLGFRSLANPPPMKKRSKTSYESLSQEILSDEVACASYAENRLRREMAEKFFGAMAKKGMTEKDLLSRIGKTQLPRLLHREVGGDLNLYSIVRLAQVLGLRVKITLEK